MRQPYTGWAAYSNDEPERIEGLYRFTEGRPIELFIFMKGADRLTRTEMFNQDNLVTTVLHYYNDGKLHVVQKLNEEKHGTEVEYQKKGSATKYTQYKDGEMHGCDTKLHDTGLVVYNMNYVNGKLHGTQLYYSQSGAMDAYREMKNGENHGVSYSYEGTNISEWYTYKNGKKTGPYREYNTRDIRPGITGYFDENGERTGYQWDHEFLSDQDKAEGVTFKASVTSYINGEKDGLYISANGGDAGYKKGAKWVGQQLSFLTRDGFIHSVTNYNENGKKDGPAYRVNSDTTHLLEAREHYKNGEWDGLWYKYLPICDTGSVCHSLSERPYLPEPEHESFSGLRVITTWVKSERRGRYIIYDAETGKKVSESNEE